MYIKLYYTNDTALLEFKKFKLYDLGSGGLNMMLQGDSGERFSNRYEISNINYTNKSVEKPQSMQASEALYKDNMLYLNDDVMYRQGESFTFRSDEALYDEKAKTAYTSGKFELKSSDGVFRGTALEYNSETQNVNAKAITATYHLNKVK